MGITLAIVGVITIMICVIYPFANIEEFNSSQGIVFIIVGAMGIFMLIGGLKILTYENTPEYKQYQIRVIQESMETNNDGE